MTSGIKQEEVATPAPRARKPARGSRVLHGMARILRTTIRVVLMLALLIGVGVAGVFVIGGRTVAVPVWAVAEVERRLNRTLGGSSPMGMSVGGIAVTIAEGWVPKLQLSDLRLVQRDGATFLTLPEARIVLDPAALLRGELRPRSLTLVGAKASLRRDREGRFNLDLGEGAGAQVASFAALLDMGDAAFDLPALQGLTQIDAEAMTLTLEDARAGRTWQVGDGRLTVENRRDEVAAQLGMTLVAGGAAPSQATLTVVTQKASPAARITATVDQVAASDLATQIAQLAFLSVLDAPISGQLTTAIDGTGKVGSLEGQLQIGAGALRPTPETKPVAFDRAGLYLRYDSAAERLTLDDISVDGASVRLKARGQVLMPGVALGVPTEFLTQITFDEVMVDPEGLFQEPVRFSEGALDLRLRLDPFILDIGQLSLVEDGRRVLAKGRAAADEKGWQLALDFGLNEIAHQKLLALWPVGLVPNTRKWLVENVQDSLLFDVKAALRLTPGQAPRLSMNYEFAGTDVRFLKTLPPIQDGVGYATIEGSTFTMVLDKGRVTPPKGGDIDMTGSVFSVLDITQRPAQAEVRLKADSSLTAMLSLLDEPPFGFLTKAGRGVDLGQGRAVTDTLLRLPLVPKIPLKSIRYEVTGTLYNLQSDVLVPGHRLTADALTLFADPSGMTVSGPGKLGKVAFDGLFSQGFAPEDKGKSRVEGTAELSPVAVREFGLGLPDGSVTGLGKGKVVIDMVRGQDAQMTLTSDVQGLGLALPELNWTKPKPVRGSLEVSAHLGKPGRVDSLTLKAAGLTLKGTVDLRASGGLDVARFSTLSLNDWLDAEVTMTGRGAGQMPKIAVTGGRVDMRKMTFGSGSGGAGNAGEIPVRLDRLTVSDSIDLTSFAGAFRPDGGFRGNFTARVNGAAAITGAVAQVSGGTGVRIISDDAGAVLAAAGIFADARGGKLDMQMVPAGPAGHYDGTARASNLRVKNAPVLAELLNAVSVIGLIEQMGQSGLLFGSAEAEFLLTPEAIEVTRASAVGASLGVSMAGLYVTADKRLQMQGVISPIYILNGIGGLFSRQREGLFGFNYQLTGTADAPQVSVNPLSILTPGMFREIFRQPAPVLARPESNG